MSSRYNFAEAAEEQVQGLRGTSICEHNRQRHACKDCGGASICQHNRERRHCRDSGMCAHSRIRSKCKECKERRRST